MAVKPTNVFDVNITNEGWIQTPTEFIRIGEIDIEDVERGLKVNNVMSEAASQNCPQLSGKVLKWWKRAKISRFIKSD
jgi:hypothetical protein